MAPRTASTVVGTEAAAALLTLTPTPNPNPNPNPTLLLTLSRRPPLFAFFVNEAAYVEKDVAFALARKIRHTVH